MARLVELPLHLYWSEPARAFDLDDRRDLVEVYEIVLREGATADIERYIDPEVVLDLWNELFLPPAVERAWHDYFTRIRGVDLPEPRCSRLSRSG